MPTIKKPNQHFDAVLWTGDGTSSKTISSYNFAPDLIWAKNRSDTSIGWSLYDTVRGAGSEKELATHGTTAEGGDNHDTYGYLSAFTSNGFTGSDGSGSPNYYFNKSSSTYVAYGWKAGGASTVNTSGSISSNVSVNTTAGFSIVTYTGTGANATVGHGLGVAPKMVIVKNRTQVDGWAIGHSNLTSWAYVLQWDSGAQASVSTFFNSNGPTSSVFSVGSATNTNQSGQSFVAYCFAEIEGYSKFGSYTGNGSTDGPFQYTGFRPKYVMIKRTDTTADWHIHDAARNTFNVTNNTLYPGTTDVEDVAHTAVVFDFLSNGFKLRATHPTSNNNGNNYIYVAFAESPFKYSNAR